MNNEIVNALRTIDSIERRLNTKDVSIINLSIIINNFRKDCEKILQRFEKGELDTLKAKDLIYERYRIALYKEISAIEDEIEKTIKELEKMMKDFAGKIK